METGILRLDNFLSPKPTAQVPLMTYEKLVEFGNNLISRLITSEDVGIMSGDILKAYGAEAMFKTQAITPDFTMESTYSPEVLTQINTATLCGEFVYAQAALGINQVTGESDPNAGIIYQGGYNKETKTFTPVQFKVSNDVVLKDSSTTFSGPNLELGVLNLTKDSPTPDDNMVASRLLVTGVMSAPVQPSPIARQILFSLSASGSEVLCLAHVFQWNTVNNTLFSRSFASNNLIAKGSVSDVIYLLYMSAYVKFE